MAEREIKTTLALDGEKEFKASMDEAYRGMKVLGSEMKLNTSIFGDNASSMEGMTKKGEILGKEISQQKEIVSALSKAVEDSAAAYGENDKRTDAYRIKLNNASSALNRMEGDLDSNEKAINEFGKETASADKKTHDWGETLKKVGETMGKGVVVAAKATAAAVLAVGAAAITAGKQIFDLARDTGKFADDLITTSMQTGISTTSLQEWGYAAQFIDTEVSTITGSMAKMTKGLMDAADGTGKNAEAFATLGVSITDSNGTLLSAEEIFFASIDALGQVGNATERDALAMQLFGKSAQELNPLIIAGSGALKDLGAEAQAAGLIMSEESLSNFGAFDDTMNRITSTMTGVGRNIASIFLPSIQSAATGVQELMTTINTSLADGFQPEDIETIGAAIAEKLSDGMQKITEYLPQIISTISDVLTKLISFAVEYLPKLLPQLMTAAIGLLQGALKAIKDNIKQIAETVKVLIKSFVEFVTGNLPLVIDVAIEIILAMISGLVGAIPDLIRAIPQIVTALVGAVIKAVPEFLKIGGQLVAGLWEGIQGAAAWLWEQITGWIGGIWKGIKGFFGIKSPSSLMADTIGKPMVQGMAIGITKNAKLVDSAIQTLMPDTKTTAFAMDVTRRFNDSYNSGVRNKRAAASVVLSDSAIGQIVSGFRAALTEQGDTILIMNDREFARGVRKVALA